MSARGLGRGFDALIPTDIFSSEFDPTQAEDKSKLVEIELDKIFPDEDQPRREFKEEQIDALAKSIEQHGVLQPIVVTKEGGKYKIVAGERRWRASKVAGIKTIPCIVRTLDAQNRLELSLIENVQREDLNAIETATAYAKLKNQFNMTVEQVAQRVGKSVPSVVNTMRLLTLPDEAKRCMIENHLSEGQMRPLITATKEQIMEVLPRIVAENWSARKVEQYMVEIREKAKAAKKNIERPAGVASEIREEELGKKLGVKVKIHTSTRGSGKIMLKFKNEKEYEKLCMILAA